HDDDLFAANTLYDQNRVTPHANGSAMYDAESGVVRVSLPPVSWTALHIK
ncbi:alpha-L-arabinofuranosidase, partial [Bifidobacterium longum]